MKRILFITHNASRSGAPFVLLHLLKWLKSNTTHLEMDILFISGGPLERDFKEVCSRAHYINTLNKQPKFIAFVWRKLLKKIGIKSTTKEDLFYSRLAKNNYDLIYANTVVSVPFGMKLKNKLPDIKFLLHIHELNIILKESLPDFKFYTKHIDYYIAASKLVKNNLVVNWGINSELIRVIYEFSTVSRQVKPIHNTGEFIVGSAGEAHWRKGDDLFIQVANYMKRNYPEVKIKFVWVGNYNLNKDIIEADVKKGELEDMVYFVGQQDMPEHYYKNFSVFFMSSREDPFPLVCIELAMLEKPIICFEGATGTEEILKEGGGFIVPYLDIKEVCEKILYYYNNPKKRDEDGKIAQKLFANFTPEHMCPKIYNTINTILQ